MINWGPSLKSLAICGEITFVISCHNLIIVELFITSQNKQLAMFLNGINVYFVFERTIMKLVKKISQVSIWFLINI